MKRELQVHKGATQQRREKRFVEMRIEVGLRRGESEENEEKNEDEKVKYRQREENER